MKKTFFYLIAAVVGGGLTAQSVCAQARETTEASTEEVSSSEAELVIELPEPKQREDFWEHFEQEVFEAAKGEQDKEKAMQILRYGEKLIELNRENKFACSAANRLVVSLFFLGRLEDALRLADTALSLPETEHGDHMVARHHKSLCYMELGDHQAAQEAAAEALASDGPEEWAEDIRNAAVNKKAMRRKIAAARELLRSEEGTKAERAEAEAILLQATKGKYLESLYLDDPSNPPGYSPSKGRKGSLIRTLSKAMRKDGRIEEAREVALAFIHENPCDPLSPSIARDMCDREGEDYGMAALEGWIAFFEEKGCGKLAEVASLRLCLKDAYTGVAIGLRTGSEERDDVAQGVGVGRGVEGVQEASGGSGAVDGEGISEGGEGIGGDGSRISGRGGKGAIGAGEARTDADHWDGAFGNVWGDWVLGGVASRASPREADSPRMN